jgi:pyruvate,water dikinase
MADSWVLRFDEVRRGDVGRVGGKNASLGEMIAALGQAGVRVPSGRESRRWPSVSIVTARTYATCSTSGTRR